MSNLKYKNVYRVYTKSSNIPLSANNMYTADLIYYRGWIFTRIIKNRYGKMGLVLNSTLDKMLKIYE